MNESNLLAVLYSLDQNCFHVEYLKEYIDSNIHAILNKKDQQYVFYNGLNGCHRYPFAKATTIAVKPIHLDDKE